jgi:hypothetical protein
MPTVELVYTIAPEQFCLTHVSANTGNLQETNTVHYIIS